MQITNEARFTNLISVDNTLGVSINLSGETDDEKKAVFKNSYVYGEAADLAKDCPSGGPCWCHDKMGHMSSVILRGAKTPHNPATSPRPVYKVKTYGTWNQKAVIENVTFSNFKTETTACGAAQRVFGINQYGSDIVPMHYFTGVNFVNVKYEALISIFDPPQGWANLDDCCEWPCTMPSNIVYNYKNAVFQVTDNLTALPPFWTAGTTTSYSFQLVSDFASAVGTYPNCSMQTTWNAWICADPAQTSVPAVGTLLFESLDEDTEDRSVQPVIITNSDGYRNVLNSFMDHTWDGFYTG